MPHELKPKKKSRRRRRDQEKVLPISIFNQVEVKVAPHDSHSQTMKDQSQEDGVTGCFKSLFGCLKP